MNVKRKVLGIFICIMMLATIPLAAGIAANSEPEDPEPTAIGRTFIRGIITKPSLTNGGSDITFRCMYVHYRTRGIGESQTGVLRLFQKITLENDFIGHVGNHWVFAIFDGQLDV